MPGAILTALSSPEANGSTTRWVWVAREPSTLRDNRHESAFRPTLGNKLSAWFAIGNVREAYSVIAVESPIDALSYYTLFAGRNDPLAVVSCSGSTIPDELMWQTYDRRQRFVVALDNDTAGERGWQEMNFMIRPSI